MSYNGGAINPSQLNPALLQAMAVAQAQNGPNSGNGGNAAFQTFHQAFQRLQSQESQKLDQQRLGVNMPQQPNVGATQDQQQQFLQMMHQAGMLQNGQVNGGAGGINFANIMAAQSQSQGQGASGQINMGNMAAQMGNMGQNGFNIHSQQQGLNLPGMPDSEQGRRQMLQNMLSQQLQTMPNSQTPNPQQFQQSQQLAQTLNSMPNLNSLPGANGAQLRDFVKNNPDAIARIQQRHPDNQQALLSELTQMVNEAQTAGFSNTQQVQQPTQPMRQPSFNLDASQLPINYINTQAKQQNMRISSPSQAQRLPSNDQFQNFQAMQNQMNGMGPIDPKQMEALQAMKAAQQRGGLVTPQMQAGNLPIVSPQAQMNMSQGQNVGQMTPSLDNQQIQLPQNNGPAGAMPQRSMSQSQGQAQSSQGHANSGADVQNMIQGWGDNQLLKSTMAVVGKIHQAAQPSSSSDPTKFYLLQIIAEWKRRNKDPPPTALQTAGQALGNPSIIPQLATADWSQLAEFAKVRVDATTASGLVPNRDTSARPANTNGPGSQSNPIDMMTPVFMTTPQLSGQAQLPSSAFQTPQNQMSLQPAAQINEKNQQQQQSRTQQQQLPMVQQQPGQQSNQSFPNQATLQRPALPSSSSGQSIAQTTRPWASMDFKLEPIPLKEEQFWLSLEQMQSKRQETFVPPMIEGQRVNMFHLFSLVHRNGGSSKIGNNLGTWQHIGGYLGFGGESQPGQPQKSSIGIANQLRALHAQYLQPLEDLFYSRLYKEKMKATAAQSSTPPNPAGQAQAEKPLNLGATGMSTQFLEAVAKVPGALTEKQKKTLEEARRLSTSGQTPQLADVPLGTPSFHTTPQNMNAPNTPKAQQMAQMSNNPAMLLQWIKSREDAMKVKFRKSNDSKDFKTPSEEEKPRLLNELRAMIPAAKEAQDRTPRFLLMAINGQERDAATVLNLISMYMFIFVAVQYAEGGRYPFTLDELAKLREPLTKTYHRLNTTLKQTMASPEGQARLQKLMTAVDAAQAAMSNSMPPPATLPEDIASKLPKGLRVEDLKPPPAKRQKGVVGKASPSQSGTAGTPEAKTPAGNADSPAAPGSGKKTGAAGNKRKRQASTCRTPNQTAGDIKSDVGRMQPPPIEPAKDNMLGINLDVVEAEIQSSASFFASYDALRTDPVVITDSSVPTAGTEEIWSALIAAVDEYSSNAQNHTSSNEDITNALGGTINTTNPAQGQANPSSTFMGSVERDDDLFAQFIDVSKVDDTPSWALPTPELFRVPSRDDDADDTSPESIRTVGSSTGVTFKTTLNVKGTPPKIEDDAVAVLGGYGSPENNAYNGMIFAGWEESGFNFVSAT